MNIKAGSSIRTMEAMQDSGLIYPYSRNSKQGSDVLSNLGDFDFTKIDVLTDLLIKEIHL